MKIREYINWDWVKEPDYLNEVDPVEEFFDNYDEEILFDYPEIEKDYRRFLKWDIGNDFWELLYKFGRTGDQLLSSDAQLDMFADFLKSIIEDAGVDVSDYDTADNKFKYLYQIVNRKDFPRIERYFDDNDEEITDRIIDYLVDNKIILVNYFEEESLARLISEYIL